MNTSPNSPTGRVPRPEKDGRLGQLYAIAADLASSEDNREAARHDLGLEFPIDLPGKENAQ